MPRPNPEANSALPATLDFASVPAVLTRAQALIAGGTLDLAGVERADSSGVALLLELSRRARAQGVQLRISGANAQICNLLEFFKLTKVLALV